MNLDHWAAEMKKQPGRNTMALVANDKVRTSANRKIGAFPLKGELHPNL